MAVLLRTRFAALDFFIKKSLVSMILSNLSIENVNVKYGLNALLAK
jgi:hypothetical protein